WLGNKHEQRSLTGKVVQVSLQCQDSDSPDVCAVFRVIGRDVESQETSPAGARKENSERTSQLGLVVGIVCGVLLAFILMGVTVFWTICWKQQKERLARKIQLHVLLQQRMQEQNSAMFRNMPRPYSGAQETMPQSTLELFQNYSGSSYNPFTDSRCWDQSSVSNGCYGVHGKMFGKNDHLPPPPPYPHNKKRLYFSPEFFDPKLMANPPPPAEEFLSEVRRMINLAKLRIRGRRYTPSLNGIPEEDRLSISSEQAFDANKHSDTLKTSVSQKYLQETKPDGDGLHSSTESSPESADSGVSSAGSSTDHRTSSSENGVKLSGTVVATTSFNKVPAEGGNSENVNHWLNRINELGEEYPRSQTIFHEVGGGRSPDFYRFFTRRPGDAPDDVEPQTSKDFTLNLPMTDDRSRVRLHPDMEPMMYERRYSLPSIMSPAPPHNYPWPCRFNNDISSTEDMLRLQMQISRKLNEERYFGEPSNSLPKRLAHFLASPELRVDCQDLFHNLPYAESLPRGKALHRPGLHPYLFVNENASSRPQKSDTSPI
ncbi:unnamed protein product, partial [Soboliphyme baturini]|uniref:COesterase domain-containing protein n=1 Tax=Soboliphyme baturini TaxID=241478 RepID=A0A183J3E2_9BILA